MEHEKISTEGEKFQFALAQSEREYREMELGKTVKQLRAISKKIVTEMRSQQVNATQTIEVEKFFSSQMRELLPPGIEYVDSGSEANIFKIEQGGKQIALKIFHTNEENPFNAWSLAKYETAEEGEETTPASREAYSFAIAKDLPAVNKIVGFSSQDQAIATEFVDGTTVLSLQKIGKHEAVTTISVDALVRSVMIAQARGIVMDAGTNNVMLTKDKRFVIIDFLEFEDKPSFKVERLLAALSMLESNLTAFTFDTGRPLESGVPGERTLREKILKLIRDNGFLEESETLFAYFQKESK